MEEPLALRMLVAVPRSGSTLFMRIMAGYPNLAVTSRNVRMGNMAPRDITGNQRGFNPDYSIFLDQDHPVFLQSRKLGKNIVVSKEEFGNDRFTGTPQMNECNFDMFPNDEAIRAAKPVFTFRKPEDVFDSWLARGWSDLDSFLTTYKNQKDTFDRVRAINPDTVVYTYETLRADKEAPQRVFKGITDYWNIPFDERTLTFNSQFGSDFIYRNERERQVHQEQNPKDIFTTLMESRGVRNDVGGHGKLQPEQRAVIQQELASTYSNVHEISLKRFGKQSSLGPIPAATRPPQPGRPL